MNILVTGCAGFIGSHVVEEILNTRACNVVGIDKLTYASNLKNLDNFSNSNKFTFVKEDICNYNAVYNICKKNKINWIINLAAETHVDNSIFDCENFIKSNILGTSVILKACKEQKINLIHFSTDEVYGIKLEGKFQEIDNLNPKNPYSATKAAADHLIKSFENTYGVNAIIVRPSNNYGPRQHKEKLLPKIVDCINKNTKIPVYGDGKQAREWTYVKDTAQAVNFLITKGKFGEIYNISSGQELQNLQIIKMITEQMNVEYSTSVKFVKDRPGHDVRYAISNLKLKNLGYNSYVSIRQGLRETICKS
jgi:dTDP-glucose 4,6-dehydratase